MRGGVLRALALTCLACAALGGCASLYHLDEYSTGETTSSSTSGDGGVAIADDDTGVPTMVPIADEAGTDQCASESGSAAVSSCGNTGCIPFDNVGRIMGFSPDAGLPPIVDASAPGDSAVATAEAGAGSGGAADSGSADGGADASSSGLPACSSLPRPVYMIGSSGLTSIAAELGALASTVPITVIYTVAHSCDGAKAIVANETAFATGATTANYWDVAGTTHSCELDIASEFADIGLGNVFAPQCLSLPQGLPSYISDYLGPITPGTIVVPSGSSQTSISAEALYYAVGLGNGAVAPWTSTSFLFVNPGSGVQLDFGLDIGVPAARWLGSLVSTATVNVTKVTTSPEPEQTLGTMSTDLAESASTSSAVKELAFQDVGQSCGYYPNSTATSADKRNVRNGQYPIWGFTHMFAKVNAQSVPVNPDAATVIGYFTGTLPTQTGNFLKYIINDHLVPVCAMNVTRSAEMGRLSPFTPSPSCGCYFDSITAGASSCQTCSTSADCPNATPHCNIGYCEAN
jgi:hypothetical protein